MTDTGKQLDELESQEMTDKASKQPIGALAAFRNRLIWGVADPRESKSDYEVAQTASRTAFLRVLGLILIIAALTALAGIVLLFSIVLHLLGPSAAVLPADRIHLLSIVGGTAIFGFVACCLMLARLSHPVVPKKDEKNPWDEFPSLFFQSLKELIDALKEKWKKG